MEHRRILLTFLALVCSNGYKFSLFFSLIVMMTSVSTIGCVEDRNPHHREIIGKKSETVSISRTSSSDSSANTEDGWDCKALDACSDKLGFEAVQALHHQLDDDANGNVDIAESDEFLRDELQYENGYERQKEFHRNDKHITVDELWTTWKSSEVHNWTIEETIEWLVSNVELPQYVKNFQENAVDGTALPRMAVNTMHFLSNVLGIKDPIHKQKISLKAMDVVLFGPPKYHNYIKDVLLVFSLVIAIGGCWFAFVQHKYSQCHMRKMMKDMESLQNAEEALHELQKELDQAKMEQEIVAIEKQNLERRLQDEIITVKQQQRQDSFGSDVDQSKIQSLENELRQVQEELQRAELALETKSWVSPPALQQWLQMTHELELKHYNHKKAAAEQQLAGAKEGCEKLRKKRSSFMGAFRVAHGSSIDDVDNRILQAKAALSEVTKDLQERLHRWRQIEILCGFSIVHNPGLLHLQSLLGTTVSSSSIVSHTTAKAKLNRSGSEGTITEDDSSYSSGISAIQQLVHNSATLFLAPLPPSYVGRFADPTTLHNYPSSGSPRHDSTLSLASSSHHSSSLAAGEQPVVNGSLANIAIGCPQRHSVILDSQQEQLIRKAVFPDMKSCASSSAILQRSDVVNEQLTEYVEEDENGDDFDNSITDDTTSLNILSTAESPKPMFTVGGSNQENSSLKSPLKKIIKSHGLDQPNLNDSPTQKLSQSETCLDSSEQHDIDSNTGSANRRVKSSSVSSALRTSLTGSIVEEEAMTDSSSTLDEENLKDRKKRAFLPHLKRRKAKTS